MAPTTITKVPKRSQQITRALRSLPAKVSGAASKSTGRHWFSPLPGEAPIVIVRVQILSAKDLLARDKSGISDPFVVVSVLSTRQQTPVAKKTSNPLYTPKDATFDFPIHLSLADKLGVLELILWDKDLLMKKDYLGEASLHLEDWFAGREDGKKFAWEDATIMDVPLVSTRIKTDARGSVQIKLGFVRPPVPDAKASREFADIYADLVKLSRPSVVSAAPTEGVGTLRSHQIGPEFHDDGLSSDEEDEDEDVPLLSGTITPLAVDVDATQSFVPPISVTDADVPLATPTAVSMTRTPVSTKTAFNLPRIFPIKRPVLSVSMSTDSSDTTLATSSPATPAISRPPSAGANSGAMKTKFRKSWGPERKKKDYNLNAENDVLGIVMLEILGATDLPRLKNMTRTGWDMDPFVVISFSKKVFRTRVIRHSLNPVWEEKMLFQVRQYESTFEILFVVSDWDKLSANDHVGNVTLEVADLMDSSPKPNPETGLYDDGEDGGHPMKEFKLRLEIGKGDTPYDSGYTPMLSFRAKYQPYAALRQQFWRQYLQQYDADETATMSHVEITSMLDSLGSTLSRQTINSFFTRFNKRPYEDELTIPEAVQCLETEICRPTNERKKVDLSPDDDTTPNTPSGLGVLTGSGGAGGLPLDKLDFSGPKHLRQHEEMVNRSKLLPPTYSLEPGQRTAEDNAGMPAGMSRHESASSSDADDYNSGSGGSSSSSDASRERVINVKNCPLCHRPRLNSKAELDIVTHLAICASQDWSRVDKIVVGNFVTASQAQRKWYTKILGKISGGDYRLGANSANIIVQNRITGQLEEEKMQVYVRLGIRLLYKGAKSRMEGHRARNLLKSMSTKQGIKYDAPESARDIPGFIEFHNLDVSEIRDPVDSFKNFNEFFYRKLKVDARPVESPDDPYRLVSGADCRLMAFETVNEATRLWIKGRDFTIARLLGEAYAGEGERYSGGSLCIFRLAPQDYHRFHVPVDGVVGSMTYIAGEYYTVNPQAIRTALDVYGENARKVVPIDSPQFGRVMAVCIGAMMVGSIKTTVQEGDSVKRGDEFGYFAFGGSTIVVLFEKGMVEWDEDLLVNGRACLETLVRVGMGIGRGKEP